jgi:DNA-binding NarL/FixJ family response regulator
MKSDRGPILIVDDDANFRALVAALVARAGLRSIQVAGGGEALAYAKRERPALVLLDVCLPGVNGYEVCRELRDSLGDRLPIVFVSGERIEALDRSAGILVGADDYVTKPFDPDELLARIRRLISPARVGRRKGSGESRRDEPVAVLTRRESEVLALLADGRRTAEIAVELVISEKTVATHLQRVLAKLNVSSRAQAVAAAYRLGLVEVGGAGRADAAGVYSGAERRRTRRAAPSTS